MNAFTEKEKDELKTIFKQVKHWQKIKKIISFECSQEDAYNIIYPDISSTSECGKSKTFISLSVGYTFCGTTRGDNRCQCAIKTMVEKVAKARNNLTEEQKTEIHEKYKNSMLAIYGTDNIFKDKNFIEKNKFSWTEESSNKRKMTNLEKYGVENPRQNIYVSDKIKKTCLDRYGTENPLSSDIVKEKVKSTMEKKYGETIPARIPSVMKKTKTTNLEKYGVENVSYSPEIIEKIREVLIEKYKKRVLERINKDFILIDDYKGVCIDHKYIRYSMQCKKCSSVSDYIIANEINPICRICTPIGSGGEQAIYDWLLSEGFHTVTRHNRQIIKPFELDLVIEDKKIAIEYCGLYWHSEEFIDKFYHKNKLQITNAAGYRLITIFEDEWLSNTEATKNRLRHILGKTNKKLFARKTKLSKISCEEIGEFLDKHHLQKTCNASINYCLKNIDNDVVAVMNFSKARFSKNTEAWELVRFASDGLVVGGAQKLFSAFIKDYHPKKIISYADLRWSNGKLYEILGFDLISITSPNYWYFKNLQRLNRMRFMKSKLIKDGYDSSLTESVIMKSKGYNKIWDCGSLKYEWKYR
jgi:hypothetical protein